MNLSEVNWDFEAAGTWPLPVKAGAIAIVCIVVAIAGVYFDISDQRTELEVLERKEQDLKRSYAIKQKKAVNLVAYKEQLQQIEASLGEMIKQMPTKAEVASLLIDISQTGLASGLEFRLFQPAGIIHKEFYSELPIKIRVVGRYEELGLFISGLASLPRIVTVHDVQINPVKEAETMVMDATVKTYNEGVEEGSKGKQKTRNRK